MYVRTSVINSVSLYCSGLTSLSVRYYEMNTMTIQRLLYGLCLIFHYMYQKIKEANDFDSARQLKTGSWGFYEIDQKRSLFVFTHKSKSYKKN